MTLAVPVLRVHDVDSSLEFWRRLGFTESFRHQFEPDFPRFVGLQRDECHVFLSEHRGDAPGPALVYLWVEDVDAVAGEFGVAVEEMPWARECEICDPDGNRVRAGTPAAG